MIIKKEFIKKINEKEENILLENYFNNKISKKDIIIKLFYNGYNIKEISNKLNIIYNMVYNYIKENSLKLGFYNEIDFSKNNNNNGKSNLIKKLFLEGKNVIEICIELKIGSNYCNKVIKEIKEGKR
jgi:transposase